VQENTYPEKSRGFLSRRHRSGEGLSTDYILGALSVASSDEECGALGIYVSRKDIEGSSQGITTLAKGSIARISSVVFSAEERPKIRRLR